MPRLKLTQLAVDKLTWASAVEKWREEDPENRRDKEPGRVEVWDTLLAGFGLIMRPPQKATPKGRKTWQVLYRVDRKMVRETLGTTNQIPSVAAARERAQYSMAAARTGKNPVVEKREAEAAETEKARLAGEEAKRKAATLGALLGTYLDKRPKVNQKGKPLAPEYLAEIERALKRDIIDDLGKRPMNELADGKDIKALLYDMARVRPSHARHLHAYLRTAAEWLADNNEVEKNFMTGIKPPAPKVERTRTLKEDYELRLFWQACDRTGWPFGPLFQLLVLLGPRRDELAESTWNEFDLTSRIWSLPDDDAKNDEGAITHLPQLAADILKSLPKMASAKRYVFTTQRRGADTPVSGFSSAWRKVEKIMQELAEDEGLPAIEHFTRHDLRRTIAYGMAKLGVAPHIADKILNHSGGSTITGVMRVYNRFQYLNERKDALDLWAAHIEKLIGLVRPRSAEPAAAEPVPVSNVVDLATARASA